MPSGSSVDSVQLQKFSMYNLDRIQQSDKMPGAQGRRVKESEHEWRSNSSEFRRPFHRTNKCVKCLGV